MARIFFSADSHGSTAVWRKWIRAQKLYSADVLMLSGDLTGKLLVPLVKDKGGYYTDYFGSGKIISEEEASKLERTLEDSGTYVMRTTWDEVKELQKRPEKVEEILTEAIARRMEEWLRMLLQEVDVHATKVLVMPGNDDYYVVDEVIKRYEDYGIIYPLDKIVEIDSYEVISYDYVNPTPWNTAREASESKIKEELEKRISKLNNPKRVILNVHAPPYGTRLDLAPELDKNMKPVMNMGQPKFIHVGSKAVRDLILKYRPALGLHGHIHESSAVDKLGDTLVFNPGSEYEEGILRGYVVELSRDGVGKYWRVEG
ncbi:MAG: metallophosphoesterase family protein [Conexivisphaera sp.]